MDLSKAIKLLRNKIYEYKIKINNTPLSSSLTLDEYQTMRELSLAIEIVLGQLEFLMEYEIERKIKN